MIVTYINISNIDTMKGLGTDRLPIATAINVYDLIFLPDQTQNPDYVKMCPIATNDPEVSGATQVCYADNETFGAGENFQLAMHAGLQALLEDYCTCQNLSSGDEISCSVFDPDDINSDEPDEDEEIDDLPETPDDEPVNPCDLNPCSGVEHSTGVCNMEDSNNYSCECDDPCWFWDGEACIHDDTCGE